MPNMDGWKRSIEAEIQKVGQAAADRPACTEFHTNDLYVIHPNTDCPNHRANGAINGGAK